MPASHSKRNTTLAFFTSYERSLLRTAWGSQRTRLTRDSFLPFASCQLCLLPSREPVVACGDGHLFCRECAVANLLAQRGEIARLERDWEVRKGDERDRERLDEVEERERAVKEFERVQMGLRRLGDGVAERTSNDEDEKSKGTKRKFEIDEEELLRIAKDERRRMRNELDAEKKAANKHMPAFWIPSETPNTDAPSTKDSKPRKLQPLCPSSSEDSPHAFSLKSLTTVHFSTESDPSSKDPIRTCPACKKALSNSTKAVLAVPCGHVLCKPCAGKFLKPSEFDPGNPDAQEGVVRCYVCEADLSGTTSKADEGEEKNDKKKKKKSKKDKDAIRPGLVDLVCDGTGFAGGGKNLVQKNGLAFQC